MVKINRQDVQWLHQLDAGLMQESIPEFDRSRLVALDLVEEKGGGLSITQRGQEALAGDAAFANRRRPTVVRILLVDDDATYRYALSRSLEHAGHSVTEAGEGREAVLLHQAQPFDVVITDLVMPRGDGIEAIAQLRQRSAQLPIIAYTGRPSDPIDLLAVAKLVGASEVLRKPFETSDLLSVVARV